VTATIIGATSLDQFRTDIAGVGVTLPDETFVEIETIQRALPDPCP
jgi:aryl-alcohol dehydrogenase-like predicted oxidoreductase